MPPKGDMLTKAQTDLIKQWITEGAKFGSWKADAVAATTEPAAIPESSFRPLPPPTRPRWLTFPRPALSAMNIAQNTNFIDIEFQLAGDKITDAARAPPARLPADFLAQSVEDRRHRQRLGRSDAAEKSPQAASGEHAHQRCRPAHLAGLEIWRISISTATR